MQKAKIFGWAKVGISFAFIYWYFGWTFLSWSLYDWVAFGRAFFIQLPSMLVSMIPAILFFEVFLKGVLLQSVPPLKIIPAEPEFWLSSSLSELSIYTSQLEQLGFVPLTDYTTLMSKKTQRPIVRLFANPHERCFAEVGVVGNLPMFCTISSHLENGWTLGVTNAKASNVLNSTWYAFLRLPNRLGKCVEGEPIESLFRTFLDWRGEILQDLNLEPIQKVNAEVYFKKEQEVRAHQRSALLRKSVFWSFIEMISFSQNPKTEWLGAYKRKAA